MPFVLKPGKLTIRKMRITIPGSAGRYDLRVGTLLEKLAWSDSAEHLSIDCLRTGQDQFTGTVTREDKKNGTKP